MQLNNKKDRIPIKIIYTGFEKTFLQRKYTNSHYAHKRMSSIIFTRERQNKDAMRSYFALTGMAILQETDNNNSWGGHRKNGALIPC